MKLKMAAVKIVITIFGLLQTTWSTVLFDPATEICCSGEIQELPAQNSSDKAISWFNYQCCGQDLYNVKTHMCCLNRVHPRPPRTTPNTFHACCGDQVYNPAMSLCCNGTVIAMNTSRDGNIDGNSVSVGFLDSRLFCCGSQTYDWKDSMCCSSGGRYQRNASVVVRPTPFSECCGGQTYDIRKAMCCSNVLHPSKDPNSTYRLLCCGRHSYNPVDSICCHGNLVVNKPDTRGSYICCGDQPQLMHQEMCCDNTVVPITGNDTWNSKCCGNTTYNVESELCCNGVPQPDPDKDVYCCGTDVYRPELKEFCCGHVVHRVFSGENYNVSRAVSTPFPVCCGNTTLNDPKNEICCQGRALSRAFGRVSRCCGPDVMDGERSRCCKGRIWQNINSTDACCGDKMYDTSSHSCCYENRTFSVIEQVTGGRRRSACCYG